MKKRDRPPPPPPKGMLLPFAMIRKDVVKRLKKAKNLTARQAYELGRMLDDDFLHRLIKEENKGPVREELDMKVRKVIAWKTIN